MSGGGEEEEEEEGRLPAEEKEEEGADDGGEATESASRLAIAVMWTWRSGARCSSGSSRIVLRKAAACWPAASTCRKGYVCEGGGEGEGPSGEGEEGGGEAEKAGPRASSHKAGAHAPCR